MRYKSFLFGICLVKFVNRILVSVMFDWFVCYVVLLFVFIVCVKVYEWGSCNCLVKV